MSLFKLLIVSLTLSIMSGICFAGKDRYFFNSYTLAYINEDLWIKLGLNKLMKDYYKPNSMSEREINRLLNKIIAAVKEDCSSVNDELSGTLCTHQPARNQETSDTADKQPSGSRNLLGRIRSTLAIMIPFGKTINPEPQEIPVIWLIYPEIRSRLEELGIPISDSAFLGKLRIFDYLQLPEEITWSGLYLINFSFCATRIEKNTFEGCKMVDLKIPGALFKQCSFSYCHFINTHYNGQTTFGQCNNTGSADTFSECSLVKVKNKESFFIRTFNAFYPDSKKKKPEVFLTSFCFDSTPSSSDQGTPEEQMGLTKRYKQKVTPKFQSRSQRHYWEALNNFFDRNDIMALNVDGDGQCLYHSILTGLQERDFLDCTVGADGPDWVRQIIAGYLSTFANWVNGQNDHIPIENEVLPKIERISRIVEIYGRGVMDEVLNDAMNTDIWGSQQTTPFLAVIFSVPVLMVHNHGANLEAGITFPNGTTINDQDSLWQESLSDSLFLFFNGVNHWFTGNLAISTVQSYSGLR